MKSFKNRILKNINRTGFSIVAIIMVLGFGSSDTLASQLTPKIKTQFNGVYNTQTAPPSSVVAVNSTTVFEIVNSKYAIYNRSGDTLASGSQTSLLKAGNVFVSDPQVMWDPSSNRFYFSVFENAGSNTPNEGIAWGFSKTADPTNAGDFCTYFNSFNYGSTSYPDRESLGDTTNYLLIGADRFSTSSGEWESSDLAWISKPAAGTKCPASSTFSNGISSLPNPGSSTTYPYSPVPARQVDSSTTGWVGGIPAYGLQSTLSLYKVNISASTNTATITSSNVNTPAYNDPPNAPQPGTTISGDPAPGLETREYLTQITEAFDPTYGRMDLWTANTIAGGAGSEVQWYEINPTNSSLDQVGIVSDPNLYVYNATIAPDRLVNSSVSEFGQNAVIDFNTSSSTSYTAIRVVSIKGTVQSTMELVTQSEGPDVDFTCFEPGYNYCRWGDYSGAAPDAGASPSGMEGGVWISNQWNISDKNDSTPVWRTTLADIKP